MQKVDAQRGGVSCLDGLGPSQIFRHMVFQSYDVVFDGFATSRLFLILEMYNTVSRHSSLSVDDELRLVAVLSAVEKREKDSLTIMSLYLHKHATTQVSIRCSQRNTKSKGH
jgi:hypothetical protein